MTDANLQVAFFRNMNLGQARSHSPTRAVLEGAFTAAGAVGVRSFQTNGTVLFDPVERSAQAVVDMVRASLAEAVGYGDIAPVQPVASVSELVRATRSLLSTIDRGVYVTFFEPTEATGWAIAGSALDTLGTTVVTAGRGWVVTQVALDGDPTTAVQRRTGVRATTRGFGTIERLLAVADSVTGP